MRSRRRRVALAAWLGIAAAASSAVARAAATHQPPPTAAAPAPGRAAIESVLRDMTAAAQAGDSDQYLAHVLPAPPDFGDGVAARFRKEQENWAKDLKDHRPLEFELEIGPGPADFGADRAVLELVMTYRMAS